MKKIIKFVIIGIFTVVFLGHSPAAYVEEPLQRRVEIIDIEGKAELKALGADVWKPAEVGMELRPGDLLRTGKLSYADVSVEKPDIRNAVIRIRGDSTIKAAFSTSEIAIDVIAGRLVFWSEKIERDKGLVKFEIRTPNTIVGIEGSHGVVSYDGQSDATESWLKVAGGYIVNIPSGEYNRLSQGAFYVESKKKKTKIEKDVRPKIFSYDLKPFGRDYAFLNWMQSARRGAAEKYGKDYLSGKYLTFIGVSDGQIGIAPYDITGPILDEQVILNSGEQISVKGEILVVAIHEAEEETKKEIKEIKEDDKKAKTPSAAGPSRKSGEKTEEGKKEKEKGVTLEIDKTLEESQEPIP